jgi:plastocyanin
MPRRRVATAAAVAAVLIVPAAARAATYEVYAGADKSPGEPKQSSANAFFPRAVTVHRGDVVRWEFRGFHSVTLPVRGAGPPPLALVDPQRPVSGETDAAGNAFWFNGQPNVLLNPISVSKSVRKTWNGSRVLNSGLPLAARPKPYNLRFRRTGVFFYYCVVHPGMRGSIRVVSPSRRIASPDAVEQRQERQIRAYVSAAKRETAAPPPSGTPTVEVGRTTSVFALYRMFPSTLTVTAGQTVDFTTMREFRSEVHTVTFGPEKVRSNLEKNFIAPVPGAPRGALGLAPRGVYPSDPLPLPPYDGANHGDGFFNAGLVDNDPSTPFPESVQITFTKPGTYAYECVIHEHMDGKIVVR